MNWDCPLVFLSVQSREALVGGVLIREDRVKQRGAVCFLCFCVFCLLLALRVLWTALSAQLPHWQSRLTLNNRGSGASRGLSGSMEATPQGASGHKSTRVASPQSAGLQQTVQDQVTKAKQLSKMLPAYLSIKKVKGPRGMTPSRRMEGGCWNIMQIILLLRCSGIVPHEHFSF